MSADNRQTNAWEAEPGNSAAPAVQPMVKLPSREAIVRRAHEIYVAGGCQSGQSEQNWLQAERELLALAVSELESQKNEKKYPELLDRRFVFSVINRYAVTFATARSMVS